MLGLNEFGITNFLVFYFKANPHTSLKMGEDPKGYLKRGAKTANP
jgi:hypothetical protein